MMIIEHASVNNVKINNFSLPESPFMLFYGPSGSGKTTVAIDIILQESRRRYLENLRFQFGGTSVGKIPTQIKNLPVVSALEQYRDRSRGSFETIEVSSQIQASLRVVFQRYGAFYCRKNNIKIENYDAQSILATCSFASNEKIIILAPLPIIEEERYHSYKEELLRNGYNRVYVKDLGVVKLETILHSPKEWFLVVDRIKWKDSSRKRFIESVDLAFVIGKNTVGILRDELLLFRSVYFDAIGELPKLTPELLLPKSSTGACGICLGKGIFKGDICQTCRGTGMNEIALRFGFDSCNFEKILTTPIRDVGELLQSLQIDDPMLDFIMRRISTLCEWQLGNLTLSRKYDSLSTGEKSLLGTCMLLCNDFETCLFILDEPSLGLDKKSLLFLIDNIKKYLSSAKRCIVIDHNPLFKEHVDKILYFGPQSGMKGGQISDTPFDEDVVYSLEWGVSPKLISLPKLGKGIAYAKGGFTLLWGDTGSGKSILLRSMFEQVKDKKRSQWIEATEIQGSSRSCVASFCGILTETRSLFAQLPMSKMKGYGPSSFSFNQKTGQCSQCSGIGEIITSLPPLPKIREICPKCEGKRYKERILDVRFKGHSISDVLHLEVNQALVLFASIPKLYRSLQVLQEIGLGYISLGQNTHTLSGGEARRLRIAVELMKVQSQPNSESELIFIDNPLSGLHKEDQNNLFQIFDEMMRRGCSLIVASHSEVLQKNAHHIIPLTI